LRIESLDDGHDGLLIRGARDPLFLDLARDQIDVCGLIRGVDVIGAGNLEFTHDGA